MEYFSWVKKLRSNINKYYYRSCDETYFLKILEIISDNSIDVVCKESAIKTAKGKALKFYRGCTTKFRKEAPDAASEALDLFIFSISDAQALEYNEKVKRIVTKVCINWPHTKPDIANYCFESGLIYLLFNLEDPNNIDSYNPAPIDIIELAAIEAMRIFKPDFDNENITIRVLLALVTARDIIVEKSNANVTEGYGDTVLIDAERITRGKPKLDEPDA